MEKQQLIQYLAIVVDMEKNKYMQEKTISELEKEISRLAVQKKYKRHVADENDYIDKHRRKVRLFSILIGVATALLSLAICSLLYFKLHVKFDQAMFYIFLPAGFVAFVLSMIIGTSIAKSTGKAKAKEMQIQFDNKYASKVKNDQMRVQREKMVKDKLIEQRNLLFSQYNRTFQNLKKAYSVDVIYERYHFDFVAVASFYDYLRSGMCSTLEATYGRDGAYNIYEDHRRLDKIVEKLDEVISHLEQIKENQWTIYNAIQEGNSLSAQLVDETNRLANASEQNAYYSQLSAQNSAITAYNSQQAAKELNQIKWLEYSKAWLS